MGKREIETTTKRTIQTCDLCDRDLGGISPNKCDICGREAGYCCSTLRLMYDARHPGRIDLSLQVCRDCGKVDLAMCGDAYSRLIHETVTRADQAIASLLEQWRGWVAEQRAKRKEG